MQSGKAQVQGHAVEVEKQNFQLVNKPSSVHTKVQFYSRDWLLRSIVYK